jgi:RHS repeat-associated protein
MATYTVDTASTTVTPSTNLQNYDVHLYGSSRLGTLYRGIGATTNYTPPENLFFERGNKQYELTNHLGNVLATISDKKKGYDTTGDGQVDYFLADTRQATDYHPGGMAMIGRIATYNLFGYKYGFGGTLKNDEVSGNGNQYDFGSRIYDPRLGRFLSTDPMESKRANLSPYNFASNNPINRIDPDGNDDIHFHRLVVSRYIPNGHGGKKIVFEIYRWSSVTPNNSPNSYTLHKYNVDGQPNGTSTNREPVSTSFYPEVEGEGSGITQTNHFGLFNTTDNDFTSLKKLLKEFPDVTKYYNRTEVSQKGGAETPHDRNRAAVQKAIQSNNLDDRNDDVQQQKLKGMSAMGEVLLGILTLGESEAVLGSFGFRETFFRAMSNAEYTALKNSGGLSSMAGKELFVSTSANYSRSYLGKPGYDVLVKFYVKPGTLEKLSEVGVKHSSAVNKFGFGQLERVSPGWMKRGQSLFKVEAKGSVLNVGIGNPSIFNSNITSFSIIY